MRLANTALGAGLLSTSRDARTLAEGSRLLAKRTGGDTAQAFQTLTTAMASGRTAQLKQLGLFVDNKRAVEEFAEAQGKSVSQLNDADRAAALQVATMAALRGELKNNAPPLADFGELIEQGRVGVKNLVDEVAVMISNSPALLAGMRAAGDAVAKAFGGDQKGLVLGIVNVIERGSFYLIGFGQAGLTAAGIVTRGFAGIKVLVFGVALGIATLNTKIAEVAATALETAASIPGLGRAYQFAAEKARAVADAGNAVTFGLREQVNEAMIAAAGNDNLGRTITSWGQALEGVNQRMVNAGFSQRDLNQATAEGVQHVSAMGTALGTANFQIQALDPVMIDWKGKLIETSEEARLWGEIVSQEFDETTTASEGFGAAMVGVGDLVAASNRRLEASMRFLGITSREESKKTEEQIVKALDNIVDAHGKYSKEAIEAQKKLDEFRKKSSEETTVGLLENGETLQEGTTRIFLESGANFKASAVSGVKIAVQAAIAKSLASAPWPLSLVLAAGAAAAGAIVIRKIQGLSPGFREGTRDLDFQDFGPSSLEALHGREAIIPEGSGHRLAAEIARAMDTRRPNDAMMLEQLSELRRMSADLRGLPRAIQRAVRDGMLLAT